MMEVVYNTHVVGIRPGAQPIDDRYDRDESQP
jgi:hypothetical protein